MGLHWWSTEIHCFETVAYIYCIYYTWHALEFIILCCSWFIVQYVESGKYVLAATGTCHTRPIETICGQIVTHLTKQECIWQNTQNVQNYKYLFLQKESSFLILHQHSHGIFYTFTYTGKWATSYCLGQVQLLSWHISKDRKGITNKVVPILPKLRTTPYMKE